MPGGGTSSFTDPDDYQTGFREAKIDLVVTCRGDFKARLTWVELRHLHLLRAQENLPCIAYVSLAPGPVFVAFPTHADAGPIWGGVKLQSGDIVLHSRGERTHQRTSAASHWGFVSLAPEHLAYYGGSLPGRALVPPPASRILRPAPPAAMRLLHLHAEAGRLARTTPDIIAHPEVARALEQ